MCGDEAVAPLDDGGGLGSGEEARVGDAGIGAGVLEGDGKVFCGAVVTFAEGGGDDEYAWRLLHRCYLRGV